MKKVSAAQLKIADKGSIVKVTYDDNFDVSAIEKVSAKAHAHSHLTSDDAKTILTLFLGVCIAMLIYAYFVL